MKLSNNINELNKECKVRYVEKVESLFKNGDGEDPYLISNEKFYSILQSQAKDLPNLAYPDIYHYLVHSVSAYTNQELKAYKSTEAYNYFMAGYISKISCLKISNTNNFLLKSQVSCFVSLY